MAAEKRTLPLKQYAEELRQWLHMTRQYHMMSNSNMCQQAFIMSAPTPPSNSTQTDRNSHFPTTANSQNSPPRAFPEDAGTEIKIASIGKRVVAEIIDCSILLCVKFFISYLLISVGGFKAIQILDFDYALLNGELDVEKFLALSTDIVFVELVHRLFVCLYEAFCLTFVTNIIPPGGATPGKKFMGIAVIGCDEVFSLGGGRFLATNVASPPLLKSLCRSLVKNFSLSLMMPTCLTVFMYDHRRAVYDLLTGTVVIEAS